MNNCPFKVGDTVRRVSGSSTNTYPGFVGTIVRIRRFNLDGFDLHFSNGAEGTYWSSSPDGWVIEPTVDAAPQADQWDASTRGPKMANPTGKAIFKYQMPVLEQFEMKLPQGALIIRMEDQGGMFWLWAVVDTRAPDETRKFRAFKTGAPIPDSFDGKYIGFCKIHVQQELGLYIFEDVAR